MLPFDVVRHRSPALEALAAAVVFLVGFAAFTVIGSRSAGDGSMLVTDTVPHDRTAPGPSTGPNPTLPPGATRGAGGSPAGEAVPDPPDATAPSADDPVMSGEVFEVLRNDQPKFSRFAAVPSAELDLDALTTVAPRPDNGTVGDGQFRVACEYSHFAYDDPIVFPGEPGRSHLHMFFGNTLTDAHTTTESLVNSGGATCNGFELNRSAYWTPALLDGEGNVVVPDAIILYYKSKDVDSVQPMPQGLKMVAGNTRDDTFTASSRLHWSCGGNGSAYDHTNRIPDCGGDLINASVVFPNCWDGVNLDSADHLSHLAYVAEQDPCPAEHPVRLPQISILLYFPGAPSVEGWHLASDRAGGGDTDPGATLHADWWGGWNDDAMELWTNGCMRAARNCSFGQTGTDRQLAPLNTLQVYEGPNHLPLPEGSYPRPTT